MTLNISAGLKEARAVKAAADARPLVRDVVEEMTAWNPREFITAFQRWHQGAISLIHLNVLIMLEASGPVSMSGLADALDISVASATGVVDRMEARGLVERRRHPEDRRVVLVHPAKGAKKVFGDIDGRRRKGLTKLLTRLSDEELAGLLAGHRALRAARAELIRAETAREFAAHLQAAATDTDAIVRQARASRIDKIDAMVGRARPARRDDEGSK